MVLDLPRLDRIGGILGDYLVEVYDQLAHIRDYRFIVPLTFNTHFDESFGECQSRLRVARNGVLKLLELPATRVTRSPLTRAPPFKPKTD
jgi:hypothetical protein